MPVFNFFTVKEMDIIINAAIFSSFMSAFIFYDYCYNTLIGNYEESSLQGALVFLAGTFAVVSPVCFVATLAAYIIYYSFAVKFIAFVWFGAFFWLNGDSKYYGADKEIFTINAFVAFVISCISYFFLFILF
jgi:hypothetical protein